MSKEAKTNRLKARLPRGFSDRGPAEIAATRRMIETIDHGKPETPFMKVGDSIEIEAFDRRGRSPFGAIAQTVVAPQGGPS